ncbi:MAG: SPOR domain-containing protein [Oscillospiraceae bacterium]
MKRLVNFVWATVIAVALCGCGTAQGVEAAPVPETNTPEQTAAPVETAAETPAPTASPHPTVLDPAEPADGWSGAYLAFLDDNYDIFAALWPEGITGVGFIDLDLDGTPEMIVFDQGASATLGVQFFDYIGGKVYCVSSVQEGAAGAFDDTYFSSVSVCASFFESFRLSKTADGYCFWVTSANGTMETSWDEIIRFDCVDGVLTPVSVCTRLLESDPESGKVVAERYTVSGKTSDADGYQAAAAEYTDAEDTGHEARGVFLWNDMTRYDTTYDGLMTMAQDAVEAYVPISAD